MHTSITRRLTLLATVIVASATLAACSGNQGPSPNHVDPTPPPSAPREVPLDGRGYNNVDTQFSQSMIIHHEGAVEMAELALEKSATSEVRLLAERIVQAQEPQIELMADWLTTRAEPLPEMNPNADMRHDAMEMDEMDQAETMAELQQHTPQDFDRRFMELMTAHHRGTITMAEEVLSNGLNDDIRDLAKEIIADQETHISTMQALMPRQ